MDDAGPRENGRHKHDQYKSLHTQWMVPPHLMKDHHAMTMKFMSILAERDAAIQERNLALSEKKAALAERDMAIMHRDAAIADRNTALLERDNAIAALGYRDIRVDAFPISEKPRRAKRAKDVVSKKSAKKGKREDLNKQLSLVVKGHDEVAVDDGVVPVPGCSCTGVMQQCYKWGKGGWQSACCTTTLSMYPLPVMPNKRHARLGGRKMSGSAFGKLVNRLALEGHDLSVAIDLKDHWAKHGTNRYITIK